MKVSNSSPKIKIFWIKGDLSKRVWFFFLQKNPFGSTVWSVWRVVAQPNKTVTFIAIDFTVHSERVIMMTHHKSDRINQSLKNRDTCTVYVHCIVSTAWLIHVAIVLFPMPNDSVVEWTGWIKLQCKNIRSKCFLPFVCVSQLRPKWNVTQRNEDLAKNILHFKCSNNSILNAFGYILKNLPRNSKNHVIKTKKRMIMIRIRWSHRH